MQSRILLVIILALATLLGCRTSPVYNVVDAPVVVATTGKKYSQDDVKTAIIRAGAQLGWQMREISPGHLVGTLNLREHMAEVDIKYTVKSYSITYRNSAELDYDGTDIHSNYNSWVQNLDNAIRAQISTI